MFDFIVTHKRGLCDSCHKHKTVGEIDIGPCTIWLCSTCLDNVSRQISNKADKVYFDRDSGKWINLYREDIQELERLYPNCNVINELEVEMPRWLQGAKGLKKSRKTDWNRFIKNWLQKEQIKGVGL